MSWIEEYQLVLFDLDGLLVNTEEIHFEAYRKMLAGRGFQLGWDFPRYCQAAHYEADGLQREIYAALPALQEQEPRWEVLYAEKKAHLLDLLKAGAVTLMPGVAELLPTLEARGVKRCVVTHSAKEQIDLIRQKNPLLESIPDWITREDYSRPKPDPECYEKAIATKAAANDRVIGFEDTPRGLAALMGTRAQAVLVSQIPYPEIPALKAAGAWHLTTL